MPGLFLGGELAPAGLAVTFLHAALDDVLDTLTTWRQGRGQRLVTRRTSLGSIVADLEPFEAPWTREALLDCGEWTAYLNNGIDGGDPTAAAPHLARVMGVDLFMAMHAPRYEPGHSATQLWVHGPKGQPPLMFRRSIAAHCADGRWSWHEDGSPLPFEQPQRYTARRIRDRFDRPLLLEYLGAVGIHADSTSFYGHGVTVTQRVSYPVRAESAADVRHRFGWA